MRERADEPDIPARCSAICPSLGDAIANRPFELRGQRQHGAKHFAEWREIVVGNPFPQSHKLFIEHGRGVETLSTFFALHLGRAVMQRSDHARHALLAKRNQHASADDRLHPVGV